MAQCDLAAGVRRRGLGGAQRQVQGDPRRRDRGARAANGQGHRRADGRRPAAHACGIRTSPPISLRGREPVASAPDAQPPSGHAILVIGYHGADIYPTDSAGSASTRIIPEDPTGRLHTCTTRRNTRRLVRRDRENRWYAQLADAIRPASAILIVGNGKGHSNGMLKFTQYLTEHDPALLKRIVGSIESDSENLTEGELRTRTRVLRRQPGPRPRRRPVGEP